MLNPPKTREDAQAHRYGKWAGNEQGWTYDLGRCAYEVPDSSGWIYHQCSRQPHHGPGNLYCKQHAKIVSKETPT